MSDTLGNFSMFDLFKQEAETHCAALNHGLLELERDPTDIARIEPLMRGAHSIKGAARIIGFDLAVTLAHAMEDCFVAVQKGTEQLTAGRVDQLLQGVDLLEQIAALTGDAVQEWSAARGVVVEQLSAALRAAPRAAPPTDTPAAVPDTVVASPATPPAAAAQQAPAETPPEPAVAQGIPEDMPMFELFKQEAEAHCAALNQGLLTLEKDPSDTAPVDPLMRAAHSIKGAARVIGFDLAVKLAHAMEDCFVAVQKGTEQLTAGRVDQLLQGVDLLEQLAALTGAEVPAWSTAQGATIGQLSQSLRQPAPAEPGPAPRPAATPSQEPAQATTAAAPETAPPATSTKDESSVRVNVHSLDRMMQLASETMIAARRFETLSRDLGHTRETLRRLPTLPASGSSPADSPGADGDRMATHIQDVLQNHTAALGQAAWRCEELSTALYHEVLRSRMRPFGEGAAAFPRMIRDLARSLGKKVTFQIRGDSVPVDRDILRKLEAPLNHMLRNAVDHGLESPERRCAAGKPEQGTITLEALHHAGMLTVKIRDDGRGIDAESIRRRVVERGLADPALAAGLTPTELMDFLFLPGFSTRSDVTEVSGRGVGLDVVRIMVQEVAGTVRVMSEPGQSSTFVFQLPVTLSVVRAALARIAGELYAFPLARLVRVIRLPIEEIRPVEGRQQFLLDGESVGLVSGATVLGLQDQHPTAAHVAVIVIGQPGQLCALIVEDFVGEQDLVVRPLDPRLGKVPHLSSAALLDTGEPLLVLDVDDIYLSVQQLLREGRLRGVTSLREGDAGPAPRSVLVVDDSITVREVERQLLKQHGYLVDVAVDGQDGWNTLRGGHYDLLITDVDMPRMTGIELVEHVRQDPRLAQLPIIIVSYKDREEDKMAGMEAGANAYLTKASFHDDSLVGTVARLLKKG